MTLYTAKELAQRLQLNMVTIKYYDEAGLVAPSYQDDAGHKFYTDEDIQRFRCAKMYRQMGFSLDKIRAITNSNSAFHLLYMRLAEGRDANLNTANDYLRPCPVIDIQEGRALLKNNPQKNGSQKNKAVIKSSANRKKTNRIDTALTILYAFTIISGFLLAFYLGGKAPVLMCVMALFCSAGYALHMIAARKNNQDRFLR